MELLRSLLFYLAACCCAASAADPAPPDQTPPPAYAFSLRTALAQTAQLGTGSWAEMAAWADARLTATLAATEADGPVAYAGGVAPSLAAHSAAAGLAAGAFDGVRGVGATTALDTMDYWLSDNVLHPEGEGGEAEKFTETIWRLPNFYNFTIPTETPDVSPLPARTNGYVTFVSFNRPCKMNDDVLDLWSGVLNAVPGSKLILKFRELLSDAALADPIRERFAANGITNDRIDLIASMDEFSDHLAYYHQGDIALDTFPFSGATTTFQALWMGLPVVSLHGNRFISRMGASISHHAGLGEFYAATPEDYIKVCASLAQNLDRLSDLRLSLRDQVTASPLCDGEAYARNFEDAVKAMWNRDLGARKAELLLKL